MRKQQGNPRPYPRTAAVSELLHEIVAEELERIDDERLELVTITHVSVEPDLRRATVEYTRLGEPEAEAEAGEALAEHRVRLQAAVARQTRLKRTPQLAFRTDAAIAYGARIEELLRDDPSRHRD